MSTGNGARCLLVSVIYAANVRGHLWDAKGQPVCKSEATLVGDRRAPLPAVLPAEECPGRAEGALAEPPGSRLALRAGHAVPGAAARGPPRGRGPSSPAEWPCRPWLSPRPRVSPLHRHWPRGACSFLRRAHLACVLLSATWGAHVGSCPVGSVCCSPRFDAAWHL